MARVASIAGIVTLLVPAVAWSQDATVLAVALGPPLVAAPFVAQYLRSRWLLPRNRTSASLRALVVAGAMEWLLWLFVGYLVARLVFAEDLVALGLAVAGLAAVVSTVRAVGAPHRSWGFTLAMVAVFPVVLAIATAIALVAVLVLG